MKRRSSVKHALDWRPLEVHVLILGRALVKQGKLITVSEILPSADDFELTHKNDVVINASILFPLH